MHLGLRSGQQFLDWCLGGNPIPGMLIADLTEPQRKAMRERADEAIRARANAEGVAFLSAPLNVGLGTK